MNSEQIIKLGRFCYIKLYDDFGNVYNRDYVDFRDKKGDWEAKQLFWRFYWITN
jgi:hypothetical protein